MEDIRILTKEDPGFEISWENFCMDSQLPVFFHLNWLEFNRLMLRDSFLKDASFVMVKDARPVGVVPLLIEKGVYGNQFSIRNQYALPAPAISLKSSEDIRDKLIKRAFSQIEDIARQKNVCLHMTMVDPLYIIDQHFPYNYLLEYNYYDYSALTNIVDLQKKGALWNGVRKCFKPLINREKKKCAVITVDSKNLSEEYFSHFPDLYFLAAGRHVYTEAEWKMLFELIKEDKAMLILAQLNNKTIGGNYFNHANHKAYYSLGGNHPEYEKDYCIGHLLLWEAIQYYASRDFNWLEVGWQFYGPQLLETPTEKDVNISFFKRGFGGFNFPLYRGVKFFNDDVEDEYIQKNLKFTLKNKEPIDIRVNSNDKS